MLDSLRATKGGIITWIFLGAIIVVFVISFGPGSFAKGQGCGAGAPSFAARVNGETISASDWERQYGQMFRLYQQQMGEGFTRELAQQLGLPARALDAVVEGALISQEARRRGIVVSDAELSKAVYERSGFMSGGTFDKAAYEEATRSSFGSAGKYEAWLREQLLREKMLAAVAQTVKVSDAEVKDAWAATADKADVAFVKFPVEAFKAAEKPGDAEVKAFEASQGARIEQFYKDNAARFDQKKKVRVRHVLARVAPNAPPADDQAARGKIETAAGRVKGGEDFAKVAQQLSDDANTRDRGGELGFVTEGLFDPEFAKAALALEPGQVSAPVRSASGWHLVQAEEVVPAKQVSLEQAKPEIARELLVGERAKAAAQARAGAALEAARKGKALSELFPAAADAKAKQKPVQVGGATLAIDATGPFALGGGFVPKLGAAPELVKALEGAAAGEVLPRVFDTPAGPVVAVVKSREKADAAQFDKDRDAVADRLRRTQEELVRRAWVEELRKGAKVEENKALLAGAAVARGEE